MAFVSDVRPNLCSAFCLKLGLGPLRIAFVCTAQKLAKMVKMNLQLGRAESGRRRYRLIDKKSPPDANLFIDRIYIILSLRLT